MIHTCDSNCPACVDKSEVDTFIEGQVEEMKDLQRRLKIAEGERDATRRLLEDSAWQNTIKKPNCPRCGIPCNLCV